MSRKKRLLLLPSALVATAASSCCFNPQHGPCNSQPSDTCWPDGGYVCTGSECNPELTADGGLVLDSMGMPHCLC